VFLSFDGRYWREAEDASRTFADIEEPIAF